MLSAPPCGYLQTRDTRPASQRAALAFTGHGTGAGKSWEAWMKKYAEKKARGEKDLSLYSESLEE